MTDMPKKRPPFLDKVKTRHGKLLWYYRRGKGPRTPILGEYLSDEFMANYERAVRGDKPAPKITAKGGSLKWLVERYFESTAFAEFKESTQKSRRSLLNGMCETGGNLIADSITQQTIQDGMTRRKAKPHAANNWLRAVKHLFKWAKESQLIQKDPAEKVRKIRAKSTPHKNWTPELIAQYRDFYETGTRARLALELLYFTGLSRDIVELGKQYIVDGFFELDRTKTGTDATIYIVNELQQAMDDCPSGELYILPSPRGGKWSQSAFGNQFKEWCNEARIPSGYTAHGLRRSSATAMAEGEGTHAELKAVYGWKKDEMASHYIDKANRRKLAKSAAMKLTGNSQTPNLKSKTPNLKNNT